MGWRRPRLLLVVAVSVLMPASATMARNLPKAEPERKMVPCEGMGEGFARIQGSDTCIRLSGSMRVEYAHISGGGGSAAADH